MKNLSNGNVQAAAQTLYGEGDRYLSDHFPGCPVIPGVLLMESFRQLWEKTIQNSERPREVIEYSDFRFSSFVRPNDLLDLCIQMQTSRDTAECTASVNGNRVVLGNLRTKPKQDMIAYRNVSVHELPHWTWQTNYQACESQQLATSHLSLPIDCSGNQHVPEPFIIESIAQTAVKLIRNRCPPKHLVALVKVRSAVILGRARCKDLIKLKVTALV